MSVKLSREHFRAIIYDHYLDPQYDKKPKSIYEAMLKKYQCECPDISTIQRWCKEFRFGRTDLSDAPRSGRPSDAVVDGKVEQCRKLIMEDKHITLQEIANTLNISYGSAHTIVSEHLNCRKLVAKWVPHTLTEEQMMARVRCCQTNLELFERHGEEFLQRLITQDETKFSLWDPPTNQESKSWVFNGKDDSSVETRQKTSKTRAVSMLSVWWDVRGIILVNFIEAGITMNAEKYQTEIQRLRSDLPKKRRGMLSKQPLLLVDNAPCHRAGDVHNTAARCGFEFLEHPPYSPDLAPSDYFLFPELKKFTRGKVWRSVEELQGAIGHWLGNQSSDWYAMGIRRCTDRWRRCIEKNGAYFE